MGLFSYNTTTEHRATYLNPMKEKNTVKPAVRSAFFYKETIWKLNEVGINDRVFCDHNPNPDWISMLCD